VLHVKLSSRTGNKYYFVWGCECQTISIKNKTKTNQEIQLINHLCNSRQNITQFFNPQIEGKIHRLKTGQVGLSVLKAVVRQKAVVVLKGLSVLKGSSLRTKKVVGTRAVKGLPLVRQICLICVDLRLISFWISE
jgi:hypothetical protein